MKNLLIIVLFLVQSFAFAQNLKIKGQTFDSQNKSVLAFVHINISGTNTGVISNIEGKFEIEIPAKYKDRELIFSFVGYKNYVLDLSKTKGNFQKIDLEADAQMLNELVISSKKIPTLNKIMEKVVKHIPQNYPQQPYAYQAYYKEWLLDRDTCKKFTEAFISVSDNKAYQKPKYDDFDRQDDIFGQVFQLRVSQDFSQFEAINTPIDLDFVEKHNWLRDYSILFDKTQWHHIKFQMLGLTSFEEKTVYNISFESEAISKYHQLRGNLFVNEEDFAVLRLNFEYDLGFVPNFENHGQQTPTYYHNQEIILFRKYDTKYLPYYQQEKTLIKYPRHNEVYKEDESSSLTELYLTEAFTKTFSKQHSRQELEKISLDKDFWQKQSLFYTPQEQKMQDDLESIHEKSKK